MTCPPTPDVQNPLIDEIYLENEAIMNQFIKRLDDLMEEQNKLDDSMKGNLNIFENINEQLNRANDTFDELSRVIDEAS